MGSSGTFCPHPLGQAGHSRLATDCSLPGPGCQVPGPATLSEGQTQILEAESRSAACGQGWTAFGSDLEHLLLWGGASGSVGRKAPGLGRPPARVRSQALGWAAWRVCYGFPALPTNSLWSGCAPATPEHSPFGLSLGAALPSKGLS